jgi:ACS family glucarate transporter-like MFS transporter
MISRNSAENAPATRIRWILVFWLFVLSAVSFLDRVNISVAGALISDDFHLNKIELGWVFSAFLVGYALFQAIGGRLADRFGSRKVLAGGVVWWGIFTAITALVPSRFPYALALFMAARFLLGAGEAIVYPSSNQFVARWIPVKERGIANGWIFAGVGAGAGLTPPIISYIMRTHGWRSSFWFCAVIGVVAGAIWYVVSRDTPEQHPRVSQSELLTIRNGMPTQFSAARKPAVVPWSTVLASKEVLAVTLSYFCYGYIAWIFFSWFYIYLAEVRGLNLKASAWYATLPFLAMAVSCPLGGLLNDALTKRFSARVGRCGVAAIAMMLTAVFLGTGSLVASPRVATIVLAGGAGALYLSQSSFWSVTADIAGPSSGSVSGFMNMGCQIGGAVTASVTPIIANTFGWTTSFWVAAALSLLGASAWLLVNPSRLLATPSETVHESYSMGEVSDAYRKHS